MKEKSISPFIDCARTALPDERAERQLKYFGITSPKNIRARSVIGIAVNMR